MRRLEAAGASSTTSSPISSAIPVPAPGAHVRLAALVVGCVDVTQFFSDATRELPATSGSDGARVGESDSTSTTLLYAALQDDVVRHVLEQIGADPHDAQLEEEAEMGERTDVAPSLAPDAKAASWLRTRSRASSVRPMSGPSTPLVALARDTDTEAVDLLERFGVSHTKLRGPSSAASRAAHRRKRRRHLQAG